MTQAGQRAVIPQTQGWTAQWISPVEPADLPPAGQRPAYELRGDFHVRAGDLRGARLRATALGLYEVFLNGQRVGDHELTPGSTSYDSTLCYQEFDITDLVREGDNEITIVLSDGWYRGQVGASRAPVFYGERLGALAELWVERADGSIDVVGTGDSWTSQPSRIIRASLMDGQTTDLTFEPPAAEPVLVEQVNAPEPSISPAPPVRVIETRTPASITRIGADTWVVDFGQNASGRVRLTGLGPRGARTIIDHGEFVGDDGDLDTSHLDTPLAIGGEGVHRFVQRDEVVSDGDPAAIFEPRHTVHGFQYARVQRIWPDAAAAPELRPADLEMQVIHTDLTPAGSFECSASDINRLHAAAKWSFRGNAVDVPTDCPTRERLGWTGDYQIFAPAATRLYNVLGFSRKWLQSVRDDQMDDGRVASYSPDARRIRLNPEQQMAHTAGAAGWGDAITFVPWELYLAYGDPAVLAENWDAAVRYVEYARTVAATRRHPSRVARSAEPAEHETFIWDGSFHYGEWIEPLEKDANGNPIDPMKDNPAAFFMADQGEVGTAYLFASARLLAQWARVLDRPEDAARYAALAENVREAWRREFLDADGRTVADTQAAYVRALHFGLIPDDLRAASAARLVELIREKDTHLRTGFLSTGYLLPVLADHGYADVADELLFQRTEPSWLYMIDKGATTIWEAWEGIDADGRAHESLNHYSKGAVIAFLHTHVLGLRQAAGSAGWREVEIAPLPSPRISWARGEHLSPHGPIRVSWSGSDAGELVIDAEVPSGVRATVRFPDGHTETFEGRAFSAARPMGVDQ